MINIFNVHFVTKIKQINAGLAQGALQAFKHMKHTNQCVRDPGSSCVKIEDNACFPVKPLSQYFKEIPKKSIWYEPKSDRAMNCVQPTRYDEMYWKHSDKNERSYEQTWVEYPQPKLLPKVCIPDVCLDVMPIEKRTKEDIQKLKGEQTIPAQCVNLTKLCPKFKLAKCSISRSGKCKSFPSPSNVNKLRTPLPSFTDCVRKFPKTMVNKHCHFPSQVHICDINVEARRLKTIKKVPNPNDYIC